jgi:hypothetical protein
VPWLPLTGVISPELLDEDHGTLWVDGWQTPSEATWYTSPLYVHYSVAPDGAVALMADEDISYWVDDFDPTWDYSVAAVGVLLIGLSFARQVVGSLRQRRLARMR